MYQEVAFNASCFVNLTLAERLVDFARFSANVLLDLFIIFLLMAFDDGRMLYSQNLQK